MIGQNATIWLRAYHESNSADDVTAEIEHEPTKVIKKGDASTIPGLMVDRNSWFLSSAMLVSDTDFTVSVSALLELLLKHEEGIARLRTSGWALDLQVEWPAKVFGGPAFHAADLKTMGRLQLSLWVVFVRTVQ